MTLFDGLLLPLFAALDRFRYTCFSKKNPYVFLNNFMLIAILQQLSLPGSSFLLPPAAPRPCFLHPAECTI